MQNGILQPDEAVIFNYRRMEMKTKLALITLLLFSTLWMPHLIAGSRLDVSINLPVVQINDEPEMAVIPGTNIYFIYGYEYDYFFYDGYWWRSQDNRWYRSNHYNGTWKYRKNRYVPAPFFNLSPEWRKMTPTHSHIKYQDMKKNWKQWDKEKHWNNKQDQKDDKDKSNNDKRRHGKGRK
jgi:hypothetical protein